MARTISEIKEAIAADFMRNETVAEIYGFIPGSNFSDHFSKVSVESLLFHIFATAAWVLEKFFDDHRQDVETRIEEMLPHRPKWYRDKMLAFMIDREPIPDTDRYDTSGMNDSEIAAARVIKHAVAVENKTSSILTVKIAGENSEGIRCPIGKEEEFDNEEQKEKQEKEKQEIEAQIGAYLFGIKDAGVYVDLVNTDPDSFNCRIDIYHNPVLRGDNVGEACRKAIKAYIENLPFNGEYTNMALVDALQKVEGVKIVEFKDASYTPPGVTDPIPINAKIIPNAGYFSFGEINLNIKPYA